MAKDKFEVIKKDNGVYYFKNNKLHREDGPAIDSFNGDSEWYIDGVIHRIGGPAYSSLDERYHEWYENGDLHRLDGPAVTFADDSGEWWHRGKQIDCTSQQEFEKILKLKAFM